MNEDLAVVLNAIDGLRSDVREDQSKIWNQVDKNRDKVDSTKRKHDVLNNEVKHIVKSTTKMDKHMGNTEVHFDKVKAEATTLGYLAKKRVLIILLTALGIVVSAATGLVVAWMNGMIGG